MKKKTLGAMLAAAAIAPAVLAPQLVAPAKAQATAQPNAGANLGDVPAGAQAAEYPDVPSTHWAYAAVNRLSQIGVIEGRPGGTYNGNEPMTRYEFAVAIARLLQRIAPTQPVDLTPLTTRITTLEGRPVPDIFRADVVELINALRTEFRDELNRLGVRVTDLENRVSLIENRVPAPPRQTLGLGLLHRVGYANYILSGSPRFGDTIGRPGRQIINPIGNGFSNDNITTPGGIDVRVGAPGQAANKRFSYTELELRFNDRITDRVSATASLRSLGGTQEDPWSGNTGGSVYVRELYAVADLSDRSLLNLRGLTAILGRQRTKIGQGLLYDNQLAPTDQVHVMFRLGPLAVNAFNGSANNQVVSSFGNDEAGHPYLGSGSAFFLGTNTITPGTYGGNQPVSAAIGFPNGRVLANTFAEDNESLIHASANLFRLGGQPVSLGATWHPDGVANQRGLGFDLTLPLFNRTVGFEYVKQGQYANGSDPQGNRNPGAYIVTVPALRSRILDLDLAYGRANNQFEYFASSAANPYARSYGEAIFDRQMFLGAPLINGNNENINGTTGPLYAAAKRGYAFNGTARLPLPLLRRIPLDFMFYRAKGTDDINLGKVYTIGTGFNLTPGLDLELKMGRYDVPGPTESINYYRLGANVGF